MAVEAEHVLYANVAKPTMTQVSCFLHALAAHGVSISHFGKSARLASSQAALIRQSAWSSAVQTLQIGHLAVT